MSLCLFTMLYWRLLEALAHQSSMKLLIQPLVRFNISIKNNLGLHQQHSNSPNATATQPGTCGWGCDSLFLNHSVRVLCIQPGKAGQARRGTVWQTEGTEGTLTVPETGRKETMYRHYIMTMCLSTHSIHTDSNTMVAVWLPKSVQLTETYGRQRGKKKGVRGGRTNNRREGGARRRSGSISECQSMPEQTLLFHIQCLNI